MGANIADTFLTAMTFGLVSAPGAYGLIPSAGSKSVTGVLAAGQRGIMSGAGKVSEYFARLSFSLPDIAGFFGGLLTDQNRKVKDC